MFSAAAEAHVWIRAKVEEGVFASRSLAFEYSVKATDEEGEEVWDVANFILKIITFCVITI